MKKAGPAARHRLGSTTGSEHKSRSFRSSSLPYFSGMRRSTAPPDFEADACAPGFGPMDILNPTACASASRVDRTQSPRLRSLLKVSGRTPALAAHLRSDQFRAAAAASIDFSKRGRSVFISIFAPIKVSLIDFKVNQWLRSWNTPAAEKETWLPEWIDAQPGSSAARSGGRPYRKKMGRRVQNLDPEDADRCEK